MDAEILEPSYGVTIDVDGIARVQRLGQMFHSLASTIWLYGITYTHPEIGKSVRY